MHIYIYIYIHQCSIYCVLDMRDMRISYVRHDSFICKTWLIHMWHTTHSYVTHDSVMCMTWPIHMWASTRRSDARRASQRCETWLIHTWDMTHLYARHDLFICHTRLIHRYDVTYSYVNVKQTIRCAHYRCLLQNIIFFIGLFCKRDL